MSGAHQQQHRLLSAVRSGDLELVKLSLLGRVSDVDDDEEDGDGDTPLALAAKLGHEFIVEVGKVRTELERLFNIS